MHLGDQVLTANVDKRSTILRISRCKRIHEKTEYRQLITQKVLPIKRYFEMNYKGAISSLRIFDPKLSL